MDTEENRTPRRAQQESPDEIELQESGKPEATSEEVAHAHDGAVPEDRIEEKRANEEGEETD